MLIRWLNQRTLKHIGKYYLPPVSCQATLNSNILECYEVIEINAARKVDKKVANLMLKVATLNNQLKTGFNRFLKVIFLDFVLELVPDLY